MYAALHGSHGNARGIADYHLSGVSNGGGAWEEWNIRIRDASSFGEFVGESAQARAQHQGDLWAESSLRKHEGRGCLCVIKVLGSAHIKTTLKTSCQFSDVSSQSELSFEFGELFFQLPLYPGSLVGIEKFLAAGGRFAGCGTGVNRTILRA